MYKYLLLLSVIASSTFAQWEVEVEPIIEGTDLAEMLVYPPYIFGTAVGATDCELDPEDLTMSPPLPSYSAYAFFKDFNPEPSFRKLIRDFRSSDDDTVYWTFHILYGGRGTLTEWRLEWDPLDIPDMGEFRIALVRDTSFYARLSDQPVDSVFWELADDMRDVSEISVSAPDVFYSHPVIRYIRSTASTEEMPLTPTSLTLPAHPNPFNSAVEIDAPAGYAVTITDTDGRHVATLGTGSTRWIPGEGQPSGVYLVKAEGDGESLTQRIVYMK